MSKKVRIAIVGSRDFNDLNVPSKVFLRLAEEYHWHPNNCAFNCGEAIGADTLGKQFAIENGCETISFNPDWDAYGKRAGILRNIEMSDSSDVVIAFWDGVSKGTKHMIECSKSKGKSVFVFDFYGNEMRSL